MTPRPEKEPTTRPSDRSRGRVLLIADDRAQFVETLNDRGIDVFGVSNGTAAIVSLTRTRPHLVIADATSRGLRVRELAKMLADPQLRFTLTPENVLKFTAFKSRNGTIKARPESWKELFFPEIHPAAGS